jgi:hypothetical protein
MYKWGRYDYRPRYYRRRPPYGAIFITILIIILGVLVVIFNLENITMMLRGEKKPQKPAVQNPSSSVNQPVTKDQQPKQTPIQQPIQKIKVGRSVYISLSNLSNINSIDTLFEEIKSSGIDGIILDIKTADGKLTYISQLNYGFINEVTDKNGLDLKIICEKAHDKGLYVVGRMAAFFDDTASRRDKSMAIQTSGVNWLDYNMKGWLNPYNAGAVDYLTDIIKENVQLGVDEIQLTYVQFPVSGKLKVIDYGEGDSIKARQTALANFIIAAKRATSNKARISVELPLDVVNKTVNEAGGQDLTALCQNADIAAPVMTDKEGAENVFKALKAELLESSIACDIIPVINMKGQSIGSEKQIAGTNGEYLFNAGK